LEKNWWRYYKKPMTADKTHTDFQKDFGLLALESMAKYTSFRVGGPADLLARPRDRQTLVALIKAARKKALPITIIGGGTNTLVSDKGIRGLVIILTKLKSFPSIIEDPGDKGLESRTGTGPKNQKPLQIKADTGERLSTICQLALDQGLSGLEFAAGIPGTLGGAIYMNAGTATQDISQVITSVDVINIRTLEFQTIEKKDLGFSYRQMMAPDMIILGAILNLTKADVDIVKKTFNLNLKIKNAGQPVSQASAGCFFKNPSLENPAGKLIELAGLKGKQINGARISNLHGNFIINKGNAKCEDILALKKFVQETVFKKYQIKLETEVRVIGG
jgi:UDP-N-acetylmuramate dehydrogenase